MYNGHDKLFEERIDEAHREILESEYYDLLEKASVALGDNGYKPRDFQKDADENLSRLQPGSKPYKAIKQLEDFVLHASVQDEKKEFDRKTILDGKTHNQRIFEYYGNSEAHFTELDY